MVKEHKIKQRIKLIGSGNSTFAYILYYDNCKRITIRLKSKVNLSYKKYVSQYIATFIAFSALAVSIISIMR